MIICGSKWLAINYIITLYKVYLKYKKTGYKNITEIKHLKLKNKTALLSKQKNDSNKIVSQK